MNNTWRTGAVAGAILLVAASGCARKPSSTPEARGQAVFTQLGCNACHTTDGAVGVGPTLKGLYGSQVKLAGGATLAADEAYLRESILDPDAKIVEGYSKGLMSAAVSRDQVEKGTNLADLMAFIKSLKD